MDKKNVSSPNPATPLVDNQEAGPPRPMPKRRGKSGPPKPKKATGIALSAGKMIPRDKFSEMVKPKYLSTSSSDRNDPMLQQGVVISGSNTLVPIVARTDVRLDFAGFIQLVAQLYDQYTAVDKTFAVGVPLSAFQAYCVTMLWRRLMVVGDNGRLNTVMAGAVKRAVVEHRYLIPKCIAIYLSSVGSVSLDNRKIGIWTPPPFTDDVVDGVSGSFGPMDADTSHLYGTIPSPFIVWRRLQQDLVHTNDRRRNADWICGRLSPQVPDGMGMRMTQDCLGYGRSVPLSPVQVGNLAGIGISFDAFELSTWRGLPYHPGLLNFVESRLRGTRLAANTVPEPISITGSRLLKYYAELEYGSGPVSTRAGRFMSYERPEKGVVQAVGTLRLRVDRGVGLLTGGALTEVRRVGEPWALDERTPIGNAAFGMVPSGWNASIVQGLMSDGRPLIAQWISGNT